MKNCEVGWQHFPSLLSCLFHCLFLCLFSYADCCIFLSCPAQNIALCITTFRGQGASMAQQDPCWIYLQSLLESSVLYFLLRASSANVVCQCCRVKDVQLLFILYCFVRRAPIIFFYWILNDKQISWAAAVLMKYNDPCCQYFIFFSAALHRTWTV